MWEMGDEDLYQISVLLKSWGGAWNTLLALLACVEGIASYCWDLELEVEVEVGVG